MMEVLGCFDRYEKEGPVEMIVDNRITLNTSTGSSRDRITCSPDRITWLTFGDLMVSDARSGKIART